MLLPVLLLCNPIARADAIEDCVGRAGWAVPLCAVGHGVFCAAAGAMVGAPDLAGKIVARAIPVGAGAQTIVRLATDRAQGRADMAAESHAAVGADRAVV